MPCTLLTGSSYSGSCEIQGATSATPGELVRLSVKIADRWTILSETIR